MSFTTTKHTLHPEGFSPTIIVVPRAIASPINFSPSSLLPFTQKNRLSLPDFLESSTTLSTLSGIVPITLTISTFLSNSSVLIFHLYIRFDIFAFDNAFKNMFDYRRGYGRTVLTPYRFIDDGKRKIFRIIGREKPDKTHYVFPDG